MSKQLTEMEYVNLCAINRDFTYIRDPLDSTRNVVIDVVEKLFGMNKDIGLLENRIKELEQSQEWISVDDGYPQHASADDGYLDWWVLSEFDGVMGACFDGGNSFTDKKDHEIDGVTHYRKIEKKPLPPEDKGVNNEILS